MTTIFEPVSSMYNTNYDVIKNIQNIGDLNNEFNDFQDENVIHKCYIYERN